MEPNHSCADRCCHSVAENSFALICSSAADLNSRGLLQREPIRNIEPFHQATFLPSETIKMASLNRFHTIIDGVMKTALAILAGETQMQPNWHILPSKKDGFVVKGRGGMASTSTSDAEIIQEDQKNNLNRQQAQHMMNLSMQWPTVFPRLLHVEAFGEESCRLTMEGMEMNSLHLIMKNSNGYAPDSVPLAAKFLIDTLAALFILHRQQLSFDGQIFGPEIGFSAKDNVWKLISSNFVPFTAEAAAADVLALGDLFFNRIFPGVFNSVFLSDFDFEEDDPDDSDCEEERAAVGKAEKAFLEIQDLMAEMKELNSSARISAPTALGRVHQILLQLDERNQFYKSSSAAFTIEALLKATNGNVCRPFDIIALFMN